MRNWFRRSRRGGFTLYQLCDVDNGAWSCRRLVLWVVIMMVGLNGLGQPSQVLRIDTPVFVKWCVLIQRVNKPNLSWTLLSDEDQSYLNPAHMDLFRVVVFGGKEIRLHWRQVQGGSRSELVCDMRVEFLLGSNIMDSIQDISCVFLWMAPRHGSYTKL